MPKQTFFNLPEDKRQAILDLAIEEFAEHDYKNASISRLVNQAGIAKGSFYQYFADKKALYLYLIDMAAQEKRRFFQAQQPPEGLGIFEYLRWLIGVGIRFEFANPRLAQISYRAVYGDAPLPAETKAVIEEGMMGYFRQLVQQGREQNAINPDIDPDVAAFMFNAVFAALGDYLLKRLTILPETLLIEHGSGFADPKASMIFDQILHILESGMGTKDTK